MNVKSKITQIIWNRIQRVFDKVKVFFLGHKTFPENISSCTECQSSFFFLRKSLEKSVHH